MNYDIETNGKINEDEQSQSESDTEVPSAQDNVEDKIGDAKESESSGSTTTTLQIGSQQRLSETCPYTLRKKIKPVSVNLRPSFIKRTE